MIRRFTGVVLIFFVGSFLQACAGYYQVELLDNVDKNNLPAVVQLKTCKEIWVSDYCKIEKGSIIKGQVRKIVEPRRLERDAYVSFVPISCTISSKGIMEEVNIYNPQKTKIRPPRKLDKKDVTANTIGTGLALIPPFSFIVPVFQFGMGVYNQQPGEHPFRAGCRYLVNSWPICYCLKGKEIKLVSGSIVEVSIPEKLLDKINLSKESL